MKKATLITLAVIAVSALASCSGDHASDAGSDSTRLISDVPSNRDTFRVQGTLGESGMVESYGSGGTKIKQDTSLKKTGTTYTAPKTAAAAAPVAKDSTKATADSAKAKK